jgi:sugar/nucleoside kinase (ribokinase family)
MTPASRRATGRRRGPGPIDYLIMGHVTLDRTEHGMRLGGTAAYAGLTALALGLRVGLVTACRDDLDLSDLDGLMIKRQQCEMTSIFQNIGRGGRRRQVLQARADDLDWESVPAAWRSAPIVHLGPVAGEVPPAWAAAFPGAFVGVTPQGWWRRWDLAGRVQPMSDGAAARKFPRANAAVFSRRDVKAGPVQLRRLSRACEVTAVTDGADGADIFWGPNAVHLDSPAVGLVDDTGAGDIYAASFFTDLAAGSLPVEAGRAAGRLAAISVEFPGVSAARAAVALAAPQAAGRP